MATHYSKEYIQMIQRFLKDRQRAKYWRTFQRLGEEFQLADLDIQRSLDIREHFPSFQPRACYYNAAMLAFDMSTSLDYMEGIATCMAPVEHAWLVDRTWNRVIDVSWVELHQRARKPEHKIKDYFGVRIPLAILREIVLDREIAGPTLQFAMDQLKEVTRRKRLVE